MLAQLTRSLAPHYSLRSLAHSLAHGKVDFWMAILRFFVFWPIVQCFFLPSILFFFFVFLSFFLNSSLSFLDASSQLYMRVCPSVRLHLSEIAETEGFSLRDASYYPPGLVIFLSHAIFGRACCQLRLPFYLESLMSSTDWE